MPKTIKIPLEMKNGEKATDMKSLVANFDIESVVGYFLDGKLKKWLDDRWYQEKAKEVSQLAKDDPALAAKLCEIFGVPYEAEVEIDTEELAERKERLSHLKQLTDDEEILRNIDSVAFNQEELAELYDKGSQKIYLCEGDFHIPKSKQDLEYIVICEASAVGLPIPKAESAPITPVYSDITIDGDIELNSSQKKEFQNSRIVFKGRIISSGVISFDNCDIICDRAEEDTSFFSSKNRIDLSGGSVTFSNCKITYKVPSSERVVGKSFVGGEHAKIIFDHCEFVDCREMVGSVEGGEITFISCTSDSLIAPFVYGSANMLLKITGCSFTSGSEPAFPQKLDSYEGDALILNANIQITDSTFEGFIHGVASGQHTISATHTTFIECSSIMCDLESSVKLVSCEFKKCVHLFKSKQLNLSKCHFSDCHGKIEADDLRCESCDFENGFVFFEIPHYSSGRGESKFIKCTWANIRLQDAILQLENCREHGYKHMVIESYEVEELLGKIFALIDIGNTGEMKNCKLTNIDVGDVRHIITCGKYTNIEHCVFDNCIAEEGILDQTVYTHYTGGFFDRGTKKQASYYIKSCKGIEST